MQAQRLQLLFVLGVLGVQLIQHKCHAEDVSCALDQVLLGPLEVVETLWACVHRGRHYAGALCNMLLPLDLTNTSAQSACTYPVPALTYVWIAAYACGSSGFG